MKILNSKFLNAFLVGVNFDILVHGSKHFALNIVLSILVIIGCSYSYYAIKKDEVEE